MGSQEQSLSPALGALHQRRVRRMLLLCSGVIVVASLGWGAAFAALGNGLAVGFEALAIAAASITIRLTQRDHKRAAARLLVAAMYVMVSVYTVVLDVPSAAVQRSMHQFLLVVGVVASLLLRSERAAIRHGVPLGCLVTYVVLAATEYSLPSAYALPDSLRAPGLWINHGMAAAMIFATLHLLQTDVAERNSLETELRDALVHGHLLLHFQPQVNSRDEVIGAEALVRWKHPRRGLVPPGQFIPLAEQCGLMVPLGDWVLRTACAQLAAWKQDPRTAHLMLAVNVSAMQIAQPDFVPRVLGRVEDAGIDPKRLKLELTESILANDLEDIIAKMTALKQRGIGFSLDDFGTGFSSLRYLQRLPLDQLKIDQSFVRNMLGSSNDAAIAQTVITLGRSLGLSVIAEGVETPAQRQFLTGLGCDAYQGYLFGRPMPAPDFEAVLAQASVRCVGGVEAMPGQLQAA